MDWNKAKNLTIIFLLLLNIFLSLLVYNYSERYMLTAEQEGNIIKVLSQNGVSVYADIPKSYKPMKQMLMNASEYNYNLLKNIFFENPELVKQTFELDKTIFKKPNEELTIQDNKISFETKREEEFLDLEIAKTYADKVIKKGTSIFKNLSLDVTLENENGITLEYYETNDKNIIYNNYLKFYFYNDGAVRVHCSYSEFAKYENKSIIISPDEALLLLMRYLNCFYSTSEEFITGIDIVYYQDENNSLHQSQNKLVPYYRFYLSGKSYPILINAITGNITVV